MASLWNLRIILVTLYFITGAVVTQDIPSGYSVVHSVGVVRRSSSVKSLYDATQDCERDGAHLIVINSAAKADFVNRFADTASVFENAYNPRDLWVGIEVQNGMWSTVKGLPLENVPWFTWCGGRPLDGGCVVYSKPYQCHWDVTGSCYDPNFKQPYVCEKPQNIC